MGVTLSQNINVCGKTAKRFKLPTRLKSTNRITPFPVQHYIRTGVTRTTTLEDFLVVAWLKFLKEHAFTHLSFPFAYKANQMQYAPSRLLNRIMRLKLATFSQSEIVTFLRSIARGHNGKIPTLGFFCADRAQRGLFCRNLEPTFLPVPSLVLG